MADKSMHRAASSEGLRTAGGGVKAAGSGTLSIYHAARHNNLVDIAYLVGQGQSVNTKNSECETALHIAVRFGHEPAARALLDHGAIVDARHGLTLQTPLHIACMANNVKVISLLLERGADPMFEDIHGHTPSSIVHTKQFNIAINIVDTANEAIPCKLRCGAFVLRRLAAAHMERSCSQRMVSCRLGCGAEVCIAEQDKHEAKTCMESIIDCWSGCGARLRRRIMQRHVKLECPAAAKTTTRFGTRVLRSEQHENEISYLNRPASTWLPDAVGFWTSHCLYKHLRTDMPHENEDIEDMSFSEESKSRFIPSIHGVKQPPVNAVAVSSYDYTDNFKQIGISGRILSLLCVSELGRDALVWILQRAGLAADHRRLFIEDWLARITEDGSLEEARTSLCMAVAVGSPEVFKFVGEIAVPLDAKLSHVRALLQSADTIKWALPPKFQFLSVHSNLKEDVAREGLRDPRAVGFSLLLNPVAD